MATYSFDGVSRFTWSGDGATGAVGQVSWGAMSDAGQGQMNFALVRFQINNTNLVIYDAGSSATNRPVAPEPLGRGWTFSGLGPGTATNAVSPDTFWNPVLLMSANLMVIPWTEPFFIPPSIVSASPVSLEAGSFHSLALKADGTVEGWGESLASVGPPGLSNVVMLAAGDTHNLALRSDRTILAWGLGSLGQTDVPANATNVVAIAAGRNHSLAVREDGTVVQWGNDSAMTNAPASATNVVAVTAGTTFSVALRSNGTVVAWGYSPAGQTNVPSTATGVVGISSGNHTLAVRSNGAVVAWGDNTFFQTNVPTSASNVIAVAAGLSHSLALRSNRTVVAWGAGTNNTGIAPRFGQAIVPASATNIVAIAAGDYHSLALRGDGVVIAWGAGLSNSSSPHSGQSAVPPGLNYIALADVIGNVDSTVPGTYLLTYAFTNGYGAVGVTNRMVVVYQTYETRTSGVSNSVATLTGFANPGGVPSFAWFEWGLGSRFDQQTAPVNIGTGNAAVAVSANLPTVIPGLPYRARLVTSNSLGLVARNIEVAFTTPLVGLNGPNPFTNLWGMPYVDAGIVATGAPVALAAGRVHSVALKADGNVAGWGDNFYSLTNPPASVNDGVALASGQNHGVIARANGSVAAWGDNSLGQISVPLATTNILAVAAGESFSLGLRHDGVVVGWGDDFYGQASGGSNLPPTRAMTAGQRHVLAISPLGDVTAYGYNGFNQTNVPAAATSVVAVSAGAGHSVALRADGTVLVWGLNSYFQTNLPVTATSLVALAAGFSHSRALRADGTVVAWGAGTNSTGSVPHLGQSVVPASATNVIAIAAGYFHSLAQRADGSIIAWGAGTANTGAFPSLGQAIVPGGLNSLNLPPTISGIVNTTQEGMYPLSYLGVNPFGGVGGPLSRTVVVTMPPGPSTITALAQLADGTFQFNFTNGTPASFTVLATTNVALSVGEWTVLGPAIQLSPGMYQFTDSQGTNFPQRFYQVRSP